MELFKLFGSIALNNSGANNGIDETTSKAEGASVKIGAAFEKIGSVAVKVGQTIAVGLAAGATAITALTKQSIDAYAEYEQLVGGVDTLFKRQTFEEFAKNAENAGMSLSTLRQEYENIDQAADTVMNNAANAYKTAGMSANEYMNTVTSFSASLLQGLGGDTVAAAAIADMAIIDMSDNANKMGTDISMIQNAYQGFAKQNYTMLDNLKLGYGGTAAEMARLVNESGVLGEAIEVTAETVKEVPFDKIIVAINKVQTEMGITGTTAREASSTIQGSVSAVKAAWSNLLVGMADENANLEELVNNFVDSVGTAAENILPRIEIALEGAGKLIDRLFPIIIDKVPQIINDVLPKIVTSAANIVTSLVNGISENKETIMNTAFDCVMIIIETITDLLPDILELGMQLIVTIAEGIVENLDELIDSAVETVGKIVEVITKPDTLGKLLDAALEIILALADALVESLPNMVDSIIEIVTHIVEVITEEETLDKLLDAALKIIQAIAEGLIEKLPELIEAAVKLVEQLVLYILDEENMERLLSTGLNIVLALIIGILNSLDRLDECIEELIMKIIKKMGDTDWKQVGQNIVSAISEGLSEAWDRLKLTFGFESYGEQVLRGATNRGTGVSSTGVTAAGGFGSTASTVVGFGSHADGLDYVPYDGYLAELHEGEMVVPAAQSKILRSGALEFANREILNMLERILYALQENSTTSVSLNINNREFARLVKAVN